MLSTVDQRAEWFATHYGSAHGRIRLALVLERLQETLPQPPARILDAGGGAGAFALPLAERGYQVTLLDPSEGMLRVALDRIAEARVDLTTIRGGIEDVRAFAPGPFEAICCHTVLAYVRDPEACLSSLRSAVEVGATLSLLERNHDERAVEGWCRLLRNTGWHPDSWVGIQLFSDMTQRHVPPGRFEQLLSLERYAGRNASYRPVAGLVHMSATAL